MASLKELRNRIASVQATQKITRAMQMVAASKLRRAQEAAKRRALCLPVWARYWLAASMRYGMPALKYWPARAAISAIC